MSIESRLFDADGHDESVELDESLIGRLGERQLLWVDLDGDSEEERRQLGSLLGLNRHSVHNMLTPVGRPRLDLFRDYFEMSVIGLDDDERPVGLDVFVGENWVATVHSAPVPFLGRYREQLASDTELGQLTAPSFTAALLDWLVGTYFRSVEDLEADVDRLDERALLHTDRDKLLRDLTLMRRRISGIRRTLVPHREVFAALARPDFETVASSETAPHFRALEDRLERSIAAVENARELLIGSFDIFMTQTGQRTNDVMRVLTIVSVILLPSVVIAGVMGMNFEIPFFEDPNMFWVVIAAMVVLATVVLIVSRAKDWL